MNDPVTQSDETPQGGQAPSCGLYIVLPATDDHNKQNFQLGQALHAANRFSTYDINRHVVEYRPALMDKEGGGVDHKTVDHKTVDHKTIAGNYAETCRRNGFIFLIYDDVDLARDVGSDGVLCSSLKNCSLARKMLPEQSIIGLRTSSFEGAKSALSLELDFITLYSPLHTPFHSPLHLLAPEETEQTHAAWGRNMLDHLHWWTMESDTAIAIEGPFTPENCRDYVTAGATFIDSTHHIWTHPSGNFMQGVVNMLDAFEQAKLRQSAQLN